MIMEELETIDDVIRWLGGPTRAARWLNCTDNAIIHWRRRGIPPSQHLRIVLRARKENKRISNRLLEVPASEADALLEIWRPLPRGRQGDALA